MDRARVAVEAGREKWVMRRSSSDGVVEGGGKPDGGRGREEDIARATGRMGMMGRWDGGMMGWWDDGMMGWYGGVVLLKVRWVVDDGGERDSNWVDAAEGQGCGAAAQSGSERSRL